MNILYLAHRIPYPPNKGDKIRTFNEIKYLAANHTIDLVCLADDPEDLQHKEALQKYCRKVFVCPISKAWSKIRGLVGLFSGRSISVAYFYRKAVQQTFNRWVGSNGYDAVMCFSSSMAEYIFRSNLFHTAGQGSTGEIRPRLVMDFCDIDSDKWLQYSLDAKFPMKQVYHVENIRLQAYEKRVYRAFDASFVVSDLEKSSFLKIFPEAHDLAVIKNGVDTTYFAPAQGPENTFKTDNPSLVFIGAMDYHANVDGVCWFCHEILPILLTTFPGLQFNIVGRNPAPAVKKLAAMQNVQVIGDVEDIRPWYRKADVFVVPLRKGRGVQNKVLEAMAMGRPVVSTSRANGGVSAKDGAHLMLADSPADFADVVKVLLQDEGRRKTLGENARNFVQAEYDWQKNMAGIEALLK
jgi:sugar transferase (PEP-CTERM/EpsH1 system associated)